MNKYAPHVYIIPEDDRDRQIAEGFVNHHEVDDRRIQVMPPAGGWRQCAQDISGRVHSDAAELPAGSRCDAY